MRRSRAWHATQAWAARRADVAPPAVPCLVSVFLAVWMSLCPARAISGSDRTKKVIILTPEQRTAFSSLSSRRANVRARACGDLAGVRRADVLRRIEQMAYNDPALEVRVAAARSLVLTGGRRARDAVTDLLSRGSKEFRLKLVQGIEQAGEGALGYLFLALGDEDQVVRAKGTSSSI